MENPNDFPPRPNLDAAGVDSATAPAPISTSAMPTPAPPSTSAMSTELPSTSAMPTPAPPTTSVVSTELPSTSAMPILAPPTTFAMPTAAPMSTSPRATIPTAGKSHKKPGHEAPRPGFKKSKKIASQFVEQDAAGDESAIAPAPPSTSAMPTELPSTSAMTSGKSHKRPGSKKSKKIATQMEIKFMKYWKESFKQICVPVIFDPRFKFDLLEYLLKDFGSKTEADTWMHELKKAIQKLFDEYSREILIHHHQEDRVSPDEQELEEEDDPLAEFDHYISCKKVQSNNELDRYLNEELYPRKKDLDILQWWKINSSKYPVLSRMARDILAVPASTVPSESAFSSGGRIVSDYRSSLSCSTVEALICLQDWLRAADIEGNKGASIEREEEDLEPQLDLMKQASTSEQSNKFIHFCIDGTTDGLMDSPKDSSLLLIHSCIDMKEL